MIETFPLRIEKAVYGGDGLARTPAGEVVFVPFALPGELVRPEPFGPEVLEASPARTEPRCIHFGSCGGCHYQMASYDLQLEMKSSILRETLERTASTELPELTMWGSPKPWGYRNRIRLRVHGADGQLRLGYNVRGTQDFLPISMCPIAAPVLWRTAAVLLQTASESRNAAAWLRAAAEVEISSDTSGAEVQVYLLCPRDVPGNAGPFTTFAEQVAAAGVPLRSMGASRLHLPSGRTLQELARFGANGIPYHVGQETFWLKRGSFFQVNRFLVERMVDLVCGDRTGSLAWDLYAGVGLFARRLARHFKAVTAVEASPLAVEELRRGLPRPGDAAVQETTLEFLKKAVLQRERPEFVVLDPPRAGAGAEACELLLRLNPPEIVYVSCDPATLARDLKVLSSRYSVTKLHMVDLFPQTYHLETVMVLRRRDMGS